MGELLSRATTSAFLIYRFKDLRKTWSEISKVQDTATGLGLLYQLFMYCLPKRISSLKARTLLLAGKSILTDLSTIQLDLYVSKDNGVTWEFLAS
jgi:hypothetical protein